MIYVSIFLLACSNFVPIDTIKQPATTTICSVERTCTLPPYPEHGSYEYKDDINKRPDDIVNRYAIDFICDDGYELVGQTRRECDNGCETFKGEDPTKCEKFCHLKKSQSIEFLCMSFRGKNESCEDKISSGTKVYPLCRIPNFYSLQSLPPMICVDGQWNYVATCIPECGKTNINGSESETSARLAKSGEMPWHAGIYSNRLKPYKQICGGSIITPTVVVSAASCFWNGEALRAFSSFLVAVGKVHQSWNSLRDDHVQKSEVSDIRVPNSFLGADNYFVSDIALIFLIRTILYNEFVRPVCLNFEDTSNEKYMTSEYFGKIAGWTLSLERRDSKQLKVLNVQFTKTEHLNATAHPDLQKFITEDKVCAGNPNGTAVCREESGGGMVFPDSSTVDRRYYLNGVLSTASNVEQRCKNHEFAIFTKILAYEQFIKKHVADLGTFQCDDGDVILKKYLCDGVPHCPDRSDETEAVCGGSSCSSHLLRCAYGACAVAQICDGVTECADGSDEDDELCDGDGGWGVAIEDRNEKLSRVCKLPPYPSHGSYQVITHPDAGPGDVSDSYFLQFKCDAGYGIIGNNEVYCSKGFWLSEIPKCNRMCRLSQHPSVEYICSGPEPNSRIRNCSLHEPTGTVVTPRCRAPNYYSSQLLQNMKCMDGTWDYIAICFADCGKIISKGEVLVINGIEAQKGEIPWHVAIYNKYEDEYKCGGSIIAPALVISAAHCFWIGSNYTIATPSHYAIAAGKLYRSWDDPKDEKAQKRDILDIKIPERFRGSLTHYQDDIALAVLSAPLHYDVHIRPLCVDFDATFERSQLTVGNLGKVAGWGLVSEEGEESQVLQVASLPYIQIKKCIDDAPPDFKGYITSDKICAGYTNGTALCRGDSGGGLAFPEVDRGEERYYLRGIVSSAPNDDKSCNAYAVTSFTQITRHENFIKAYYSTFYT